jgi:hypothetical protein
MPPPPRTPSPPGWPVGKTRQWGALLAPPIVLSLGLAACGISPQTVQAWRWDRANTSADVFAEDRGHCLRGATRIGAIVAHPEVDTERFATCMAIRGYTRTDTGLFGGSPNTEK